MTLDGSTCGVPHCLRSPRSERIFLCYYHWWLCPRPLRQRVRAAFRAWEYGPGIPMPGHDYYATLEAAQQAAVDAVMRRSTA